MENITDVTRFDELLNESSKSEKLYVVFFWADWHPPSVQTLEVIKELADEHKEVNFLAVEAEKVPEVSEQYPLESVPTTVFVKKGVNVHVVEGASPPQLVQAVTKYSKPSSGVSKPNGIKKKDDSNESLNSRLARLIKAAPVMLFCKGSPDAPQCGFSRRIIELLKEHKVQFGYFDILTDNAVRQGLKTYSNWPTYPQLYADGQLLGGLDVVKEMIEEGEFNDALPEAAFGGNASSEQDLKDRLGNLIKQKRVMLFMKGDPSSPQCGFSRRAVALLEQAGFTDYGHFNILEDNEVRQGLKTYSNWPTYPQLYVDGELIGGLDVITEMHSEGELSPLATA